MVSTPLLFESALPDRSTTTDLVTVVVPPLAGEYLYAFDSSAFPNLQTGDLIEVPFRRRVTQAFVLSVNSELERSSYEEMKKNSVAIKCIDEAKLYTRAFDQAHLPFYRWIAKYYVEPLSRILELAVPKPVLEKPLRTYSLVETKKQGDNTPSKFGKVQQTIVDYLAREPAPIEGSVLKKECSASAPTIRSLVTKGVIQEHVVSPEDLPLPTPTVAQATPSPLILNPEQQAATTLIANYLYDSSFVAGLLHGVTGSGKTEVYLSLIIDVLAQGKSALIIVPEIALTPQLTERFISRLQAPVAVLHSSLKPKERWRHWTNLVRGRVKVAIGARSGVFAPMHNLGLIIVDEEHDSSFKQGDGIRYNGRDLAVVRAQLSNCPILLGSATPSLETFHNARSGKYLYLPLTTKFFDAPQPDCTIVDLNKTKPWEMKSRNISPEFYQKLQETLERGDQAFVLYNKRGFASYLQCSCCEYVVGCPHCSVTLTYHKNENLGLCHQCNFSLLPPSVCNQCGATKHPTKEDTPLFTQRGAGTERVYDELRELFPNARIATLDRDSASTISDYVEILTNVRERAVDILVGTQMIAKGHDLPGVNFVGVVDCDVGLHMPDFRAGERALQLLTQVAGRAGRRTTTGAVVLQTRVPSHPSLIATAAHQYEKFADYELSMRQSLNYPPFQKILRIIVSASEKSTAQIKINTIAREIERLIQPLDITLLGPAPAPMEKVRTLWRFHLLLKGSTLSDIHRVLKIIKKAHPSTSAVRIAYDLDPHDML